MHWRRREAQLPQNSRSRSATPGHDWLELPDGVRVRYAIHGRRHRGTPLLLLRPFTGSIDLWGSFREVLAEEFRVIAFDARRIAPSSEASDTRSMARDALAVLDALNVPRVHVVGLSMGGMVATWLAIDAPLRVSRLVLASTFAHGLSALRAGTRDGWKFARCMAERGDRVEAACVRNVLSRRFRSEHPEQVERIEQSVANEPSSRAELLRRLAIAARHDARSRLHEIDAPTLVLSGADDRLVSAATIAALVNRLPNATSEIISGAGHDLSLERPGATARRIRRFLHAA